MALRLDPSLRRQVAADLLAALEAAVPGSVARLRGSLAAATADDFSDIDARWEVAAADIASACDGLEATLAAVRPLASLRLDVDAGAPMRHLAFARFAGLPLFWRVDLEIVPDRGAGAASPPPGAEPSAAAWSHTYSALMCAVAAIKAFLRGQPEEGAQRVSRGYERIHIPVPALPPRAQILALAETIYDADDSCAELADEVRRLYRDAFAEGSAT